MGQTWYDRRDSSGAYTTCIQPGGSEACVERATVSNQAAVSLFAGSPTRTITLVLENGDSWTAGAAAAMRVRIVKAEVADSVVPRRTVPEACKDGQPTVRGF